MENSEIADLLSETADLLEFQGASPFKVRALRNAARVIADLTEPLRDLVETGRLTRLPGLGPGIERRVVEILRTGDFTEHAELLRQVPRGLLELTRLEGVGPVTARLLYRELGVDSIEALETACREGKVRSLPRMGARREANLLRAIEHYRSHQGRFLISQVEPHAASILAALRRLPEVEEAAVAGSFRRRKETIGDLDILVATSSPERVAEAFVSLPEVRDVVARGPTRTTVHLTDGLQVDLRLVDRATFGAALHYFTGSKGHNIAIRERGRRMGLKVSEYGVFRGEERLGGATEEEVFRLLGLPPIPPELRENTGEIEAAEEGRLPHLIEESDLLGDLHVHTNATDGRDSLWDMVVAARNLGRRYIAICDHSRARSVTHGLDGVRLAAQGEAISAMCRDLPDIRVLRGIEADILPDGTVDMGPEVLRGLDCVVASVHSAMHMPRDAMTVRIVRAIRSGLIDVLGHPRGGLLLRREPYDVDMEAVLQAAREMGVFLEVNSYPDRLDLDGVHCRMARERGVRLAINTDAHATSHLSFLRYGVGVARRGWVEPSDVVTSLPLEDLLDLLARRHPHLQRGREGRNGRNGTG